MPNRTIFEYSISVSDYSIPNFDCSISVSVYSIVDFDYSISVVDYSIVDFDYQFSILIIRSLILIVRFFRLIYQFLILQFLFLIVNLSMLGSLLPHCIQYHSIILVRVNHVVSFYVQGEWWNNY